MFQQRTAPTFLLLRLALLLAAGGCGGDGSSAPEPQPQYFIVAYTLQSPDEDLSEAAVIVRTGITSSSWTPVSNASVAVNHLALAAQAGTPGRYLRSPMPLEAAETVALDVVTGSLFYETYAVSPAGPVITSPAAEVTIPATAASLVVTWGEATDAEAYICEVRNMATSERASVRTTSRTTGFPLGDLATPGGTLRVSVSSLNGTFSFDDPRFPDPVYDEPPYFSGFAAMARTVIEVHCEP